MRRIAVVERLGKEEGRYILLVMTDMNCFSESRKERAHDGSYFDFGDNETRALLRCKAAATSCIL